MTSEHVRLLAAIRQKARPTHRERQANDSYGGSGRPFYNVSVPDRRDIAKAWLRRHEDLAADRVIETVESLFKGRSHEEKTLACLLLAGSDGARARTRPRDIARWLGFLDGWAEVDSLCQNVFTTEISRDWAAWSRLIERLSRSRDIDRRRAALVLLTRPVHLSADKRYRDLAFDIVERLKSERDILITKAVSWLLRAMTTHHARAVERYLASAGDTLPRVAIRETKTKLRTGTKSGRKAARAGPSP